MLHLVMLSNIPESIHLFHESLKQKGYGQRNPQYMEQYNKYLPCTNKQTFTEMVKLKSPAQVQYTGMFASFTPLHFKHT